MTPLKLLEIVVSSLSASSCPFAIAGGLAASFYRKQPRLTNDVDIALFAPSVQESKTEAIRIIESLGYEASYGWIYSGGKSRHDPVALVIGRTDKDDLQATIDFLLPTFPWLERAVARAQENVIDFGFAKLPTLTPEDIIVAKAFALQHEVNRFQDMDDIQSIFAADNALDLAYVVNEFETLGLALPEQLEQVVPSALKRTSKTQKRERV